MKNPTFSIKQKQSGAIMVISLLFLIILTIVSISSITTSIMEEKSISNSFNYQKAFQASEFAVRTAEEYLRQMTSVPATQNSCNPSCDIIWSQNELSTIYGGGFGDKWWSAANSTTDETFWQTMGHSMPTMIDPNGVAVQDSIAYVAQQPTFFIEQLGYIPDDLNPNTRAKGAGLQYYQVTSRGTGGESINQGINPSQSMIQIIFGKRFN